VRLIEQVWVGETPADRLARVLLSPLELAYRGVVAVRGEMYDTGLLRVHAADIPVVSVGNITVGGTGKTPFAAWIAARLRELGRSPAIVLRGYGGDEPFVHRRINPGIPVIVAPDRVQGIAEAESRNADVVVLDDGFQHRRAARQADIVLFSADNWPGRARLLPAGPFRESMSALNRASVIIITRKAATDEGVSAAESSIRNAAGAKPIAVVRFEPAEIVSESTPDLRMPVNSLAGKRVLAIAAIGNPQAFFAQLEGAGVTVVPRPFPDHHSFSDHDIGEMIETARSVDHVVCTLKDSVKRGVSWPADASPLWYVSLAVHIERGAQSIDELLSSL
jgi:tetraacyldisaccharide 4'-kinase